MIGAPARPWSSLADGILVTVRLTPKAARDAIEGIGSGSDGRPALRVRVRAAPHEGAANDALVRLLARTLRVPVASAVIVGGHTARLKRVKIVGQAIALTESLERIGNAG